MQQRILSRVSRETKRQIMFGIVGMWGLAATHCNTFDDPPNREPSPGPLFPRPLPQPQPTSTCCPPADTTGPIVTQLPPVATSTWAPTTTAPQTESPTADAAPPDESSATSETQASATTDAGSTDGGTTNDSTTESDRADGGLPSSSGVTGDNPSDAASPDASPE